MLRVRLTASDSTVSGNLHKAQWLVGGAQRASARHPSGRASSIFTVAHSMKSSSNQGVWKLMYVFLASAEPATQEPIFVTYKHST